MKMLIGIMLLFLALGMAASVEVGGTSEKVIYLGSSSEKVQNQLNATNQTNATDGLTNGTNQTDNIGEESNLVAIKNPMSTIPVSNKDNSAFSPDSIQANSIAYRFTT